MAETRKAIHAFLTPASHEAWHEFAAENGVSVSALIEAMAMDWQDRRNGDGFELPEVDELARRRPPHRRPATPPRPGLTGAPLVARRPATTTPTPHVTPPKRWAAGLPGVVASGRDAPWARWAWSAPARTLAAGQPAPTASTARAAPGPSPTHRLAARVLRERRQGRRRGGHHPPRRRATFFADHTVAELPGRSPTTGSASRAA